ncbi:MAG: DUF3866 family protein, partial [Chloroflexi bacterium]|nr:DUF3866 family protein [Chloroflexota bacterium]
MVRPDGEEGDAARGDAWALAYTRLVGSPAIGDRVLLNTTAVDLHLGTGGFHFIIAILGGSGEGEPEADPVSGHLMKLRYTPHQCRVQVAEEAGWDDEDAARE